MREHSARVLLLAALHLWIARPAGADFVEIAAASGLFGNQPTWGGQAIDVDGDGDVDFNNGHHYFSAFLFTNLGDGTLSAFGIPQIVGSHTADRHGFLWADLDGDGALDVLCSHGGSGGCACEDDGNELWRSLGGGALEVVPEAGGMVDELGRGRSFSCADVDGDGDLDVFHAKAPLTQHPNSLYRNDGDLAFVDVAPAWNVDEELGTVGALFADYDDDGDPDLLLGGEEFGRPTVLYRNEGGSFADRTQLAFGPGGLPVVSGADWGDLDNDGDLDLVVCEGEEGIHDAWGTDGLEFWMFANHRHGDDGVDSFTLGTPGGDPTAEFRRFGIVSNGDIFLGPQGVHPTASTVLLTDDYVGAPSFTPGVDVGLYCWRDVAGGRWQIRVSAPPGTFGNFSARIQTASGVSSPSAGNLEQPVVPEAGPRVFENVDGRFTERTSELGLLATGNPRAVEWVDVDSDGDLDIHLLGKGTVETGNGPERLWRNDGSSFVLLPSVETPAGLATGFTDGAVWADFDRDGDQDVILQEGAGPLFFTQSTPAAYYRNDAPVASHWLAVTLGPTLAGGTPVGAKVTAHAGDLTVHRRVEANTWRGFQRPLGLFLGLASESTVDSLIVDWPGGGRQVLTSFAADWHLRFSEGEQPTSVPAGQPGAVRVGSLVPQPARGPQTLSLTLERIGRVRVVVYDVAGRRVRTVRDGLASGPTRITWDGRDDLGRRVPAGIYFLRGEGDATFVRKSVRLR